MMVEVTQADCDCMNDILEVIASSQTGELKGESSEKVADIIAFKIAVHRQDAFTRGMRAGAAICRRPSQYEKPPLVARLDHD